MNSVFRAISVFFQRKLRSLLKNHHQKRDEKLLKETKFIIISDNCWGGSIYQWLNRPYNTPFIGLWIYGECYIKLLSNFDYYINKKISFVKHSKYNNTTNSIYPIGKLEDVEIHFLHYKTEEEARLKWRKRTNRMLKEKDKDNYFFKLDDGGNASEEIFKKFHELPFKNKISFTINDYKHINSKNNFQIKERNKTNKNVIPNGVKLFKLTFLYTDIFYWLKNKKVKYS